MDTVEQEKRRNIISIMIKFVLGLSLLLLFLIAILHIPTVQKKIAGYVSGKVIEKSQGRIDIGSAQFDLYKGVVIRDIVLEDVNVDTLLTLSSLSISPKSTLYSLIRKLSFNDLNLDGLKLNIIRKEGEQNTNWQNFIASFSSEEESSGASPAVTLSHFEIYNVEVNFRDEETKIGAFGTIGGLEVEIGNIDSTQLHFKRLSAINPRLELVREIIDKNLSSSSTTVSNDSTASQPLLFPAIRVDQFSLVGASFTGELYTNGQYQNRLFKDVSVLLTDADFKDVNNWSVSIDDISGENKFYNLKHLGVKKIERTPDRLNVDKAFIRIDNSFLDFDAQIGQLYDLGDILNGQMNLSLRKTKVKLNDLFPILPGLEKEFGNEPLAKKYIQIQGDYQISKEEVQGKLIKIWLNGKHFFEGNGVFTKTGAYKESLLNFEITGLKTNLTDLDAQINRIKIPEELKRLGELTFKGNFDGFLNDFVAQGELVSQLGRANMDIQFDLGRTHPDSIGYAGFLQLDSFNLAEILQNDDFGRADVTLNIEKGSGVDIPNSNAQLDAVISQFEFKGYNYQDAIFKGKLSSRVIDGHFEIEDKSLDFSFDGVVDLSKEEPLFDFNVDADKIDFCQLNLATFPCQLSFSSDINVQGKSFKNLAGTTILENILLQQDSSELSIDNLTIKSDRLPNDEMSFNLTSDYLNADFEGNFNLLKVYQSMVRQFTENHASHIALTKFEDTFGDLPNQSFRYDVLLKDPAPIFEFVNVDMVLGDSTKLRGNFQQSRDHLSLDLVAPYAEYSGILAEKISLKLGSDMDAGTIDLSLENLERNNQKFEHAYVFIDVNDDELQWRLDYLRDENNRIELESKSTVEKGGYFTEFLYDDIVIDSSTWTILPNPGVGVYPKLLDIENFVVTDGRRSVGLKDINGTGIDATLREFNFAVINTFINYDKLYFDGVVDAQIRVDDVFERKGLQGFVEVPDLRINDESFGKLLIRAKRESETVVDLDMSITKDAQNLYLRGYLDTETNYTNVDLNIEKYPLDFFEYIIEEGISETVGTTSINAKIYGSIDDIDNMTLSGVGAIDEGGVKIDYIGAFYRIGGEPIKLTERYIDFSGITLYDERNNTARVSGGLAHTFLADIRADVQIRSPQFIALNTVKEDNPIYYGTGMGQLDASFAGPFDALNMRVTAEVGEFSTLYIPISSTQYGYDQSFINFNYKEEASDSLSMEKLVERLRASGLDFEMNLSFRREAEVQVIYDEETSNVLLGHGEGDMRIAVKRDGEFTVFGQYNVESGEYLYTSFGLIAKPFVIKQGGTVTWTGDPINATLNIDAYYPGLRAPLNVLLQEYIDASGLSESEFKQRRNVDLTLSLTENLFNPAINFNISFPDLVGELKTLADAKVRTLRSTENGINNQVVGLMVFRNFLPDNNPFANLSVSSIGQAGNNTITEFLTSQLSLAASEYLSDKLEGGIISGIDFEIALAQNTGFEDPSGNNPQDNFINFMPDEVQLNLRNEFKNDNFVLNIGGNYVRENALTTASNYLTGDFSLDWYITEDKRLKLRFYGVYDYDETEVARRQKYGFGINYRREFGRLTEQSFESILNNLIKEIQEESSDLRAQKGK